MSRVISTVFVLGLLAGSAAAQEMNLRKTIVTEVVNKTKDAVVNISTTKMMPQRVNPFGADPFWNQFDIGGVVKVPANSLGSGFILHASGYVVTNNHVIDRARQITVELADGRKLNAELVSADADADLAILKISSDKPLPILELGDSSDLMIGEPVIAVGNPLGFSHSVSTGIVSAIHRDLRDQQNAVLLGDLVQTDAAINPGNSGGPLLNAYGQVMGINTAIRGDAQNIGFAIQVNRLRDLIPELMNPRQANKLDLGVKIREQRKTTPPARVAVTFAVEGQSALLESIDGQKVGSIVDAYAALLRVKAEQKQVVLKLADGKEVKIDVKAVPAPDAIVQARKKLGITVEALTPMLAQKYGVAAEDGMFVAEVQRDSVAGKAGLQAGDVIVQLGRYRVGTLQDFGAMLDHLPAKGKVRVGILRGDQMGFGMMEF